MKYSDIFIKETRNSEEELYQIHFYQEGDWWRAYEWSSYLVSQFPNSLDEKHKLKPNRKEYKDNKDGIIFVGLKTSSFEKYLPNIKYEIIENKHMIVDVKNIVTINFNIDNYLTILSEWKNKFPLKETDNKKQEINRNNNIIDVLNIGKTTIMSIIFDIMTYNIETNDEKNSIFLQNIKNKLLNIFI